ncbi:catalase [Sphingomonas jinjuensis]|uniref:Catalase n=1 Tax=Sphingomonas jinjuensis TaxID=535907 RepID=A0A840FEF1_9SPHN|nr:catalase family protein [Sphingomonas jinjuensis]MBB4155211.1 catalase [Sphingomonas jinjuensis]
MTLANPVRYTPDVEEIAADEQRTVQQLNESFDTILETTAEDYGHAVRSVHAKAHGLLRGRLTIDEGLAPELAQGLFATPGEHPVLMRMSTNAGDILDDAISLPRGLAIKVLDVDGERLPGAEGRTQDFIMVNGKVFQAKTAEAFAKNLKLLAATTDKAEGAKKVLSTVLRGVSSALGAVGIESATINTLGGAPHSEPLGETYYSATPFRYGDFIAKFSLVPYAGEQLRLEGKTIDPAGRPNAIRETVQQEMMSIDAAWELRVQLCRDLEAMPIEDATVEWDEEFSPFQRVGMIHADHQDSWSDKNVTLIDEKTRFSVWTGLAAHRPLGSINRARKDTYRHSADFRQARNRCPIHEPTGDATGG